MTSQERIISAFRLEIPDRVPVSPMVNAGWLKHAGNKSEEFIKKVDLMTDIWLNTDVEIFFGKKAKKIVTARKAGNELIETVNTPEGSLTRVSNISDNMLDWVTKPFFENESDIDKFLSVEYEPPSPVIEEYSEWENRIGEDGVVMAVLPNAVCLPGLWMSSEKFLLMCVDNFNLVKKLLDAASERINKYTDSLSKSGVRFFRIAGAELASQTLMGPEWFDRLVASYDRRLVGIIHDYEGYAFYHCHGKIKAIIDKIAGIGIDALSPIEDIPNGDISMEEAKKQIGGKVCLVGNLDDLEFVGKESRKLIEERSIQLMRSAGQNGGFVLGGTESGVYTEKMLEGFLYMAQAAEKYGKY